MPAASEPISTLRLAGGRPYFLVVAPISGATERAPFGATGTVVAGRRLDGLAASLERLPARPAVLFLAGDRALATSRADLPATGWTPAVGSGIATVGGEPWALRRLETAATSSPDGALWVALPVREFARAERRLLFEFLALLAGGAVVLVGVVLAFLPPAHRTRPAGGPRSDSPRVVLERRNRELEALNAVSATIGRGGGPRDHRERDPRGRARAREHGPGQRLPRRRDRDPARSWWPRAASIRATWSASASGRSRAPASETRCAPARSW